jgi:hypothetical protein
MNYVNIYNKIINKAKSENRLKSKLFLLEKHHILPKSIGGNNNKNNLVLLTPKEHYICHRLLLEIYKKTENESKMRYAMWCMINGLGQQKRYATSSRIYENLRKDMREFMKKNGPDNRKKVEQYSIDGVFIKDFESVRVASKETGIYSGSIESCCREESKTAGGFNWRYYKSDKKVSPIIRNKTGRKSGGVPWNKGKKINGCPKNCKKIIQYSLDGNTIKEWDCISEVSKELNINRGSIENCANNKSKSAGGFNWKYSGSNKIIKKVIHEKSGRKKGGILWNKGNN